MGLLKQKVDVVGAGPSADREAVEAVVDDLQGRKCVSGFGNIPDARIMRQQRFQRLADGRGIVDEKDLQPLMVGLGHFSAFETLN